MHIILFLTENFGEFYDQADSNLNAFTDDYEIQQKGSSY
jgi:hypothetical protein